MGDKNVTTSQKTLIMGKRKSSPNEQKDDAKRKPPVTLYNFGYAPKDVIEKFQQFCIYFPTLTAAIENLLQRDEKLTYKYRFISSSVTYQMLARPTVKDDPAAIKSAILKLHKYAKDGRYKSVSDSIEELLMSTPQKKSLECSCSKNNSITVPNGDSSINPNGIGALEKITESVCKRLRTHVDEMESFEDNDISIQINTAGDDNEAPCPSSSSPHSSTANKTKFVSKPVYNKTADPSIDTTTSVRMIAPRISSNQLNTSASAEIDDHIRMAKSLKNRHSESPTNLQFVGRRAPAPSRVLPNKMLVNSPTNVRVPRNLGPTKNSTVVNLSSVPSVTVTKFPPSKVSTHVTQTSGRAGISPRPSSSGQNSFLGRQSNSGHTAEPKSTSSPQPQEIMTRSSGRSSVHLRKLPVKNIPSVIEISERDKAKMHKSPNRKLVIGNMKKNKPQMRVTPNNNVANINKYKSKPKHYTFTKKTPSIDLNNNNNSEFANAAPAIPGDPETGRTELEKQCNAEGKVIPLFVPLSSYMDEPPVDGAEDFIQMAEEKAKENAESLYLYKNCNLVNSSLVPEYHKKHPFIHLSR